MGRLIGQKILSSIKEDAWGLAQGTLNSLIDTDTPDLYKTNKIISQIRRRVEEALKGKSIANSQDDIRVQYIVDRDALLKKSFD